jgi:hypothetical protein
MRLQHTHATSTNESENTTTTNTSNNIINDKNHNAGEAV